MNEDEYDKNNENNKDLMILLAKRRKLISLRDTINCRYPKVDDGNDNMASDKPNTQFSSTTEISITPPPFSPLTPRMNVKTNQENKEHVSYTDSPLTYVHSTSSPTKNQLNGCNPDTPLPLILADITAVNIVQNQ
ncbi:unnamed protein product [Chilo suppressalis]|uniref:BESS domain-containing protein n=1 Tax=Chilo suppressalis TaxID=168631 RepID=A0ABN8EE89_CHISP|nr:hypothetical protein evm_009035 [Chilo suppressalis]CAH0663495.1 unnamed protein product [Chilo suppressalis]